MPNNPSQSMVIRVAIPIHLHRLFDYLPPVDYPLDAIKPGLRVKVPFGNSHKVGFIIALLADSHMDFHKLKPIEAILDTQPLLADVDLELIAWVSRYYHYPLGIVYSNALPALLRQGRAAELPVEEYYALTDLGQTMDSSQLKRAPKQKALLVHFQQQAMPLPASALSAFDSKWRNSLKPLLEKMLLQSSQPTSVSQVSNTQPVLLRSEAFASNPAQQAAIDAVCQQLGQFKVFLLHGVTGSGKTEVYMQLIAKVLEQGQQVLVLVPEITLTPQLQQRFQQRFAASIAISHSRLSDNQRTAAWLAMQQGTCNIMLGTRSALFTPLPRPGLIILDEEHDASFKQQEGGCRFSARDVAVVRAKMLGVPVVLGSATPALESLHNANHNRYQLLRLPQRAGNALRPSFQLLDIRNQKMQDGLSAPLITQIHETLARDEQVLLFINRRGFAPTLICHSCGWVMRCKHCDANMVLHAKDNRLRCHHCGYGHARMLNCLACQSPQLTPLGLGTERVEQTLVRLFTNKKVVRLDRDSTKRKGSLEQSLEAINAGEADIILGTQMLAKGHHFSKVTLVAMLDVDGGLFSVDFHSAERLAQLIVQVAGRAGREQKPGRVVLQTRQPSHPLLLTLVQRGYTAFAQTALQERQDAFLPPFSYHALFRVQASQEQWASKFAELVVVLTNRFNSPGEVMVLGPVPAPMARKAGYYRYQVLLQSVARVSLHKLLDNMLPELYNQPRVMGVSWSLDIDPIDLY
jgi:primosomal protein N' (replication factor Y) (superfamily II helicase)